ncbi:hypothetical protein ACFQZF_11260 [Flavobacterium myungsuense]|uniref:hypothetical protein n=1 Tax=Flavobacterium myungsuense TaxID=651823 RepID=UPI00362D6D8D
MFDLPEETLKLYNASKNDFENLLNTIQQDCKKIKIDFLSKEFYAIKPKAEINDCYSFFLQFTPYLNQLIFFSNDDEVISKLKKYGFNYSSLKWMININEIESEIRRLEKIEGLLIFPEVYLSSCIIYVSSKFQLDAFENFIGNVNHNGLFTNKLYVDSINRFRRRNYNQINNSKPYKDEFEYLMNEQFDLLENKAIENGEEKSKASKFVLKTLNGNSGNINELFQFSTSGISQSSVYYELFPLLKLILKEKNIKARKNFTKIIMKLIITTNIVFTKYPK